MVNKRLINTGVEAAPAAFDPLQNFETVTYTGNGGTQKITGYIRKGGAFNGSSSYIQVNSIPTDDTFSLSFWINATDPNSDSTLFHFYDSGNHIAANTIGIANSGTQFGWFPHTSTGGAGFTGISTSDTDALFNGSWHNVVIVSDANSFSNTKIYIDGVEKTLTISNSYTTSVRMEGALYFGRRQDGANDYNGKLDQVRIFNKALSSSEVTTLYGETYASSTKSTTDIFGDGSGVALYELDEDANDTGGTYNGTPTNVNFLGMAFQPDLVWVKNRSAANPHSLQDTVRGDFYLRSNAADAQAATGGNNISSFDSNGFTAKDDTNGAYNVNGSVGGLYSGNAQYVAWCWKAGGVPTPNNNTNGTITSTVSANQAAGFSIVKYTGNSTAGATVGHGLSDVPQMIIVKRLQTPIDNWAVYNETIGNTKRLALDESGAAASNRLEWNSTTPTSTVFTLGNHSAVNQSSSYIAYCFHSVDGYQKVGSYTGTGSSGNKQTTGFQPRFVMMKTTSTTGSWLMVDNVRGNSVYLLANSANAEASASIVVFESDGFSFSSANGNDSGVDWIYLAIA